ncbi:inositol-tetrakisphosphate 1-kinase-like isoform X1 [Saccostrea echinata]|uniref:inositol-tetrakisphosphate 1-kinase-like isoform X1 n=1 Tax=Saccostrea echinata TaxID=191078 RepID=UPI002A7EC233|nr:inositol-tetrakisphosphate 1-kinase-like isoform X1 [Saccostrea echinata]
MRRVGYWLSEKKKKRLNFEDQISTFRDAGIELVKLDVDKSLEPQGPFDLILHKCTLLMVDAEDGDVQSLTAINNIKKYISSHPECILVDSFESIEKLIDRHEQYKLLLQCKTLLNSESEVCTPTFVELSTKDIETNKQKLKEADVKYPFVCKPIVAHGSSASHKMAIIFNDRGLDDIDPPCVAQTFHNHNAVLYKVFVIGEKNHIVERPSIKNFSSRDQSTIYFDSNDVSKPNCANFLTELDEEDLLRTPITPNKQILSDLARAVRQELKMELFGIDVIIDCDTKKYAVIDINAFPGYEGVDNFMEILCDLLKSLMNRRDKVKSENEQMSRKRPESSEKGDSKKPKLHNGDKNGNSELEPATCFERNPDIIEGDILLPWKPPINALLEH